MSEEYEIEFTAPRDEVAAALSGVVDGVTAGSIRLGSGDDAVIIDVPEEISLEIELETEDDELSLEVELEWPRPETAVREPAASTTEAVPEEEDELPVSVRAADSSESLARFEVFQDKGDEWRWRLRHRNGNIIATSGEGYTRKQNARNGIRSVVQNAPEADITEDAEK